MATVILAFIVLGTIMAAMAIGVILQGKPIKGSCGGIAALGMGKDCDICGGDRTKCDTEKKKSTSATVNAQSTEKDPGGFYEVK